MDIRDVIIFGAFALAGFTAFMSLLWMCCDVSKGFDDEEYWNEYWGEHEDNSDEFEERDQSSVDGSNAR